MVIREELRRRIWPEHTFVDFEHGLNAAVTRLRRALSDSVATPRYIETAPKYGYRFCAAVEREVFGNEAPVAPAPAAAANRNFRRWLVAAAVCAAIGIVLAVLPWHRPTSMSLPSSAVPLTAFRGQEIHPALSPDASQVAFVWNGPKQDNFDIYTMRLGSDKPFRVTVDPANDLSPAWSPDGSNIAFIRQLNASHGELLLIPASGGPEHKIADITDEEFRESSGRLVSLAWSPDGSAIAASHRQSGDASDHIYLFSRTGGNAATDVACGAFGRPYAGFFVGWTCSGVRPIDRFYGSRDLHGVSGLPLACGERCVSRLRHKPVVHKSRICPRQKTDSVSGSRSTFRAHDTKDHGRE